MKLLVVRLSEEDISKIQAAASSVEIIAAQSDEEVLAAMPEADIYLPGPRDPRFFENAKNLRWVHCMWAGMDHSPFLSALPANITVTNSAGVFGVPIAEHVMAFMLAFSRALNYCLRWPREKVWAPERHWERFLPHLSELEGATLGVVGYGGIGQETAKRAKAFGMRILAIRRHLTENDGIADEIWGMEGLDDVLKESDYLLISCPLTKETRGLIGKRELSLMKPTAVIVNIARGAIIDEAALIETLQAGKLRGAGLDVTTQEPLPFDSPLWDLENVVITPHYAGSAPATWSRQIECFLENLGRFVSCKPLLNVVDREAGY